jgi:hypothetical protein
MPAVVPYATAGHALEAASADGRAAAARCADRHPTAGNRSFNCPSRPWISRTRWTPAGPRSA